MVLKSFKIKKINKMKMLTILTMERQSKDYKTMSSLVNIIDALMQTMWYGLLSTQTVLVYIIVYAVFH